MKRVLMVVILVLGLCGVSFGQSGEATLSPTVTLSVPTAAKLQIREMRILPLEQRIVVTYRWITAAGTPIYKANTIQFDNIYNFYNDPGEPVADCTAVDIPYDCCTGVGTGVGCRAADPAYNEIVGFVIRTQDVGIKLGAGIRNLVTNKLKSKLPELTGITITYVD